MTLVPVGPQRRRSPRRSKNAVRVVVGERRRGIEAEAARAVERGAVDERTGGIGRAVDPVGAGAEHGDRTRRRAARRAPERTPDCARRDPCRARRRSSRLRRSRSSAGPRFARRICRATSAARHAWCRRSAAGVDQRLVAQSARLVGRRRAAPGGCCRPRASRHRSARGSSGFTVSSNTPARPRSSSRRARRAPRSIDDRILAQNGAARRRRSSGRAWSGRSR